jgi:hypothetical protein
MSDDAPITSRSGAAASGGAPPSDHRNPLIAADRRRRTIPVKALPLVQRAVWVALAGRANDRGIAWPTIDTLAADAGTFTSTVRRALDWLIASGWLTVVEPATPRASARLRVNLEPVPPVAGCAERYPIKPKRRGSGASTEGASSALRGVAERSTRGSGASTEDHRKDHREGSQKDPTSRTRDHARGLNEDQKAKGQGVLFGQSSGVTPPTPDEKAAQKANKGGDLSLEVLSAAEQRVHRAITGDESLRPIVADPARTARDLLTKGPGVDVPHEVKCAGIWLRDNPKKAKKNGRAFLSGWIGRAQERGGSRNVQTSRPDPNAYDPEAYRPPPEAWGPRPDITKLDPRVQARVDDLQRRAAAGERIPTDTEALEALVAKMTPRRLSA